MKQKAVLSILITVLLAVPAVFLSGCATGQVVPPFNPQPIKPAPYNPEPEWNDRTDANLLALQQIKQKTGQTMPPGGTTAATTSKTTGGTTGGGGVTPVPGPPPGPPPTPSRVWSPTDPVWGYVVDRLSSLPVSGATVKLLNPFGSTIQTYMTSGDGGFSFVSLPAGYYRIEATAGAYSAIPLSSYNFYYSGAQVVRNLELLGTGMMPYLVLSDQVGYVVPVQWAYRTKQYVSSTQQTYAGILFESPSGSTTAFGDLGTGDYTTYAEYWFSVPVPATYDISYEGFWITSEQYGIVSGSWGVLGQDKVERQFYDWDNLMQLGSSGWASIDRVAGVFSSSTTGYVPFWAINRTTGQVKMRICPRDTTVFVASATLHYDFHKITAAPFINKCQNYPAGPASDSTYLEVNENVYAQASFFTGSPNEIPVYAGIGVIHWFTGFTDWYHFNDDPPGTPGTYTITVTDQAGHSTVSSPVTGP